MFLDCAPVMPWVLLWEPWALVFQVSTWGAGWETFPLGHPGRRASLLQPVPQISKQMPSLSPRSPPLLRSLCCSDWAMSPGSPQLAGPLLPAQDRDPEARGAPSPDTALGLPGNVVLGIKGRNPRARRKKRRKEERKSVSHCSISEL